MIRFDQSKIYIVDDDEGVRDSLATLLKSEGWDVLLFENGHEFLVSLDSTQGGCLLLDLNMPIMTGYEVIDALIARDCEIPIIVITSVDDARVNTRLLHLGIVEVLKKPLDPEHLLELIDQII